MPEDDNSSHSAGDDVGEMLFLHNNSDPTTITASTQHQHTQAPDSSPGPLKHLPISRT